MRSQVRILPGACTATGQDRPAASTERFACSYSSIAQTAADAASALANAFLALDTLAFAFFTAVGFPYFRFYALARALLAFETAFLRAGSAALAEEQASWI